ncbi:hypothetical protein FB451DRAFT_1568455 [Mycena latifolia]|nr:hypothetical protein FB451DRAFT_1568455 [Mycena latifolia]
MQEGCRQWLPLEALQASNANATVSTSTRAGAPKSCVMPHPVTQPRPPVATRTRRRRAPPVSTAGVGPARVLSCSALGKTSASGSSIAAAAVATPDVITHLHKHLPAPGSAHSQDAERLTTRLESRVASSSISASAAVEADLLAVQAHLMGANAQLVTAQAKKSLTTECVLFSRTPQRVVLPLPPARPPARPSAPPCDLRRRPSARLKAPLPAYRAAPRDVSPLAFLLLHSPKPPLYCLVHSIFPSLRSFPSLSVRARMRIAPCEPPSRDAPRASSVRALFVIPPPRRAHCTAAYLNSAVPAPLASRPSPLAPSPHSRPRRSLRPADAPVRSLILPITTQCTHPKISPAANAMSSLIPHTSN